jgi:hypothetical protein
LYSCPLNSFCCHLQTLPRDQHWNILQSALRSINSTKIPNTYPAASTTKIGATVTMLTSIIVGSSLDTCEFKYSWNTLARIPLSRICANLRRKLFSIRINTSPLVKKNYCNNFTVMATSNKTGKHLWTTDVDDSATVSYLKALLLVVTKENSEKPVLGLVIRQKAWTGNFRTRILALSLNFTVYFTYSKLWKCH